MQLAFYNNNEKRVRPTFSGQKGTCPLCGGSVIGKCGEIYARHWQHSHDSNCDHWKEHETPWHRNWKAKFPEDMQEVVIENYGEKHRADIRTNSETVIEFQHSSLSKSTIRIREEFYGDMIWVIDAKPFKENLRKWSVVQKGLIDIDTHAKYKLSSIEQEFADELKRLTEVIKTNERESASKLYSIKYNKTFLEKINSDILNIDAVNKEIHDKWEAGKRYWESHSADITNNLESEYCTKLKGVPNKLSQLKKERQTNENTIEEINHLESFELDKKIFKIVPYTIITNQNFHKAIAIVKESRKTFFIEVKTISNESEFLSYRYRKDKFDFAIDPTDALKNLQDKIKQIDTSYLEIENSVPILKAEMQTKLLEHLKQKAQELHTKVQQLNSEWDELIVAKNNITARKEKTKIAQAKYFIESKKEIEKEASEKRFKIMKDQKGIYTFEWKRERKSWQDAEAPIYFDFGDNYLYEKIREEIFKRIPVQEFIEHHTK
ncbi:hypothetical protein M3O96_16185 [Aquiflexum sp. TKW24L]|uniref:competence protein CoiA family protein n=1 Tax=Aquiflexum sp. TKW24L TaxID=2942212 RepID=UPI0020767980|nr:competence protein CoiA family protein [Aquiflexum sp. TKW24L]MCL6260644.1 hypothetical protein [Aquiflexum sp. TKW24L]